MHQYQHHLLKLNLLLDGRSVGLLHHTPRGLVVSRLPWRIINTKTLGNGWHYPSSTGDIVSGKPCPSFVEYCREHNTSPTTQQYCSGVSAPILSPLGRLELVYRHAHPRASLIRWRTNEPCPDYTTDARWHRDILASRSHTKSGVLSSQALYALGLSAPERFADLWLSSMVDFWDADKTSYPEILESLVDQIQT